MVFLGITTGNEAIDSLYNDEMVRKIMEHHFWLIKEFRETEFTRKLNKQRIQ